MHLYETQKISYIELLTNGQDRISLSTSFYSSIFISREPSYYKSYNKYNILVSKLHFIKPDITILINLNIKIYYKSLVL